MSSRGIFNSGGDNMEPDEKIKRPKREDVPNFLQVGHSDIPNFRVQDNDTGPAPDSSASQFLLEQPELKEGQRKDLAGYQEKLARNKPISVDQQLGSRGGGNPYALDTTTFMTGIAQGVAGIKNKQHMDAVYGDDGESFLDMVGNKLGMDLDSGDDEGFYKDMSELEEIKKRGEAIRDKNLELMTAGKKEGMRRDTVRMREELNQETEEFRQAMMRWREKNRLIGQDRNNQREHERDIDLYEKKLEMEGNQESVDKAFKEYRKYEDSFVTEVKSLGDLEGQLKLWEKLADSLESGEKVENDDQLSLLGLSGGQFQLKPLGHTKEDAEDKARELKARVAGKRERVQDGVTTLLRHRVGDSTRVARTLEDYGYEPNEFMDIPGEEPEEEPEQGPEPEPEKSEEPRSAVKPRDSIIDPDTDSLDIGGFNNGFSQ